MNEDSNWVILLDVHKTLQGKRRREGEETVPDASAVRRCLTERKSELLHTTTQCSRQRLWQGHDSFFDTAQTNNQVLRVQLLLHALFFFFFFCWNF
jgi:hypothetical protein